MSLRQTNIHKLADPEHVFDVLVVGGGINGAVATAALASHGCSVAMIDQGDFASGTSQESSNLIWGGIKYLENYEIPLVWSLCASRNRLLKAYPSNIREVRFYTAVEKQFRWPPLFLFAGTWLYWLMGRCRTRAPRLLTSGRIKREEPTIRAERFVGGVEYSDAYVVDNDARFVFKFVRSALNAGAIVANYVALLSAARVSADGVWRVRLRDVITGAEYTARTRVLINAAGPMVDDVNDQIGVQTQHRHVFSKGIHLIVPRITQVERVLTFFDDTGRMFFVIPMGPCSVIGTTDTHVERPNVEVTSDERAYLLAHVNARLALSKPLTEADIVAERCGVRPLVIDRAAISTQNMTSAGAWLHLSRKHVIERQAMSASMYGGKLTDCLNVGEEIVALVRSMGISMETGPVGWYGEPSTAIREEFFRQAHLMRLDTLRQSSDYECLSTRLWRRYDLRAFAMLEAIRREPLMDDVLIEGSQYLRCELYHAATTEMITTLEDFLRRRSKIALVIPHEVLRHSKGIREACHILFGDRAEEQYQAYFGQ